LPWLRCA